MEAKASKHASKRVRAYSRVRACACEREASVIRLGDQGKPGEPGHRNIEK